LSISLRNFNYPDDYEEVYQLWSHAGAGIHLRISDEPEEIQKKLTRDPDLFLIAENESEIVGTVMGGFDGRRGMMYHLAVSQSHRKQGIGGMLVTELEKRLREKGCVRYYLLVTRDNEDAIHFYEERGWKPMNELILGKDLVSL
jgi:ribosomal protein S18 acetylase RimI-like enzyme